MTTRFFSTTWMCPSECSLSHLERTWLEDNHSLTSKLSQQGVLSVEVCLQTYVPASANEASFLGIEQATRCFYREVVLQVDKRPFVYAKSLLPQSSLIEKNISLTQMNDTPLGAELFKFPEAQRKQLQIGYLPDAQLPPMLQSKQATHLARRSLLIKRKHPLLVAECFLPAFWQAVS